METSTELDALVPSSGAKRRGAKKARSAPRRRRKPRPKYREMFLYAIKKLKDPKGSTIQAIVKCIEARWGVRNDYVTRHVSQWLVTKRVVSKRKNRFKITGRKLKLKSVVGKKKKAKAGKVRRSKRMKKRRTRRRR